MVIASVACAKYNDAGSQQQTTNHQRNDTAIRSMSIASLTAHPLPFIISLSRSSITFNLVSPKPVRIFGISFDNWISHTVCCNENDHKTLAKKWLNHLIRWATECHNNHIIRHDNRILCSDNNIKTINRLARLADKFVPICIDLTDCRTTRRQ